MPLLMTLVLTTIEIFGRPGGRGSGIHLHSWASYIFVGLYTLLAIVSFAIAFRNTLRWGKEAEEFESELKEADKIEKERRRRGKLDRTLKLTAYVNTRLDPATPAGQADRQSGASCFSRAQWFLPRARPSGSGR